MNIEDYREYCLSLDDDIEEKLPFTKFKSGEGVLVFYVCGIDKWKAKRAKWRIREAALLGLAVLGGSIGALLGMKVWHHKTMHKKFKYGLPLILLTQIVIVFFII